MHALLEKVFGKIFGTGFVVIDKSSLLNYSGVSIFLDVILAEVNKRRRKNKVKHVLVAVNYLYTPPMHLLSSVKKHMYFCLQDSHQ